MSSCHYIHINNDDRGNYNALIDCQKENCSAWIEPCDIFRSVSHSDDETMMDCPAFERDCEETRPFCAGYCALIYPNKRYGRF